MRTHFLLLGVLVAAASLAAGCAGNETVKIPDRAPVAVGVRCIDAAEIPVRPTAAARTEAEIKALEDYKVIPRLRADRLALIEHVDKLEAIAQGCAKLPAPAPP